VKSAYRSIFRFASLVIVLAVLAISPPLRSSYARYPEKSTTVPLASPFDSGWYDGYYVNGTNDYIRAVAVDGKNIYVAGDFSVAGKVVANHIAMWDGIAWHPLGSGLNGVVSAMAVDGRGHLYVVGSFTQAGGKPANFIARWDGQEWGALGAGIEGKVFAIALDACGNVYVGGIFQFAGGTQTHAVARWDGSNWYALGAGLSSQYDPPIVHVNALSVDRFGYLYVGGVFTHAGGKLANNVARWDGTEWTPLGSGIERKPPLTEVWSLAADGRGKLYVGGEFTSAGGITAHNLAEWDGEKWSEVGGGVETDEAYTSVVDSIVTDGGNIYVGGTLASAGGTLVGRVAKWDGATWENLNGGVYWEEWIASVQGMALDRDGNLVVGGRFSLAGGKNANQVALWDGNDWNALGSDRSVSGDVSAMIPDRQGGFYVAGPFIAAGGLVVNHVAHWDGDSWSGLDGGVSGGQYGPRALALALDSVGNLYVGGDFTSAGGTAVNNIAKWVGDHWEALGSGIDGTVNSLAIDSQDNLYVGGFIVTAGSVPVKNIAKWTGTDWVALGNGLVDTLSILAVDAEDRLIAGGDFYSGRPTPYNLTCWDGTTWEILDIPLHGSVGALLVDGNTLYIGGSLIGKMQDGIFTQIGGDLSIGLDNGYVNGLTIDNKGRLVAGGRFAQVGDTPANNIARWDGNRWEPLGSGIDGRVNTLLADDQGRVLAGGPFSLAGGKVSSYLARWQDPFAVWLPAVFR
jgi:hypothetical protein